MVKPIADPPWLDAGMEQLDRIQGRDRHLKRNTLIALVDARVSGRSDASAFDKPGVADKSTFHRRYAHDEIFMDVLANLEVVARTIHDKRALRAISASVHRLALSSLASAEMTIALLDSPDEKVRLNAAFNILDRAGVGTRRSTSINGDILIKYLEK